MPFFDAHLHPLFKPYMSNGKHDIWKKLSGVGPLKSQANMNQIKAGKVDLAVVALFPLEKPFTATVLTQILGPLLSPFNKDKINDIINQNYFDMLFEELELVKKTARKNEFHVLTDINDFKPGMPNLLFSIEGAHSLKGTNSVLQNLQKLKDETFCRFFSINLAHLTQENFACHAFGAKMFKGNKEFKPNMKGITDLGWEVIHLAHDKAKGQRILVDVKHMSLFSRKKYYTYAKKNNIPILASHIGFTGISMKKIHEHVWGSCIIKDGFVEVKYKKVEGINKTKFNPWSINFYDEEIKTIIKSGGLIGLNMDQRIQGFGRVKGEYFSEKEFRHVVDVKPLKMIVKDFKLQEEIKEKALGLNEKKHLRHLCNAILHAVRIGGAKAWDHLCIGSDFDGLVNPIDCCKHVGEYGKLREGLIKELPKMIEMGERKYTGTNYHAGDIESRVEGICFRNGFEFVKKHF